MILKLYNCSTCGHRKINHRAEGFYGPLCAICSIIKRVPELKEITDGPECSVMPEISDNISQGI
jgi:hypothetical protein